MLPELILGFPNGQRDVTSRDFTHLNQPIEILEQKKSVKLFKTKTVKFK